MQVTGCATILWRLQRVLRTAVTRDDDVNTYWTSKLMRQRFGLD